jgi:hypothetical protein
MEEQSLKTRIKNLKKNNNCGYPGCKEKLFAQVMMPVGQATESGQIEFPNGDKVQSSCPLCEYHMTFAEKGILNLVEINGIIQLLTPGPIVEVVEAVIDAREFQQAMAKAKKTKTTKNEKKKSK